MNVGMLFAPSQGEEEEEEEEEKEQMEEEDEEEEVEEEEEEKEEKEQMKEEEEQFCKHITSMLLFPETYESVQGTCQEYGKHLL